jgi:MFS family permease
MNDNEIATMGLVSSLVFTVCCMAGGVLSDRFGRRLTLAVFATGTLLPTVWMGWKLQAEGWILPAGTSLDGTWPRHEILITAWWIATLVYSVFNGLMYGIRTAFCMDIVEPRIAATHFTACMALLNVCTVYSYWWEGKAVTPLADGGWGYTYLQIFLLDAALGAVFLLILPFVNPAQPATVVVDNSYKAWNRSAISPPENGGSSSASTASPRSGPCAKKSASSATTRSAPPGGAANSPATGWPTTCRPPESFSSTATPASITVA